jgi:hypothetical protein
MQVLKSGLSMMKMVTAFTRGTLTDMKLTGRFKKGALLAIQTVMV